MKLALQKDRQVPREELLLCNEHMEVHLKIHLRQRYGGGSTKSYIRERHHEKNVCFGDPAAVARVARAENVKRQGPDVD